MADDFTREDIDAILGEGHASGLPAAVDVQIYGRIALIELADKAAVEAWADRLETKTLNYFGTPAMVFRQDGYEMWFAVGRLNIDLVAAQPDPAWFDTRDGA